MSVWLLVGGSDCRAVTSPGAGVPVVPEPLTPGSRPAQHPSNKSNPEALKTTNYQDQLLTLTEELNEKVEEFYKRYCENMHIKQKLGSQSCDDLASNIVNEHSSLTFPPQTKLNPVQPNEEVRFNLVETLIGQLYYVSNASVLEGKRACSSSREANRSRDKMCEHVINGTEEETFYYNTVQRSFGNIYNILQNVIRIHKEKMEIHDTMNTNINPPGGDSESLIINYTIGGLFNLKQQGQTTLLIYRRWCTTSLTSIVERSTIPTTISLEKIASPCNKCQTGSTQLMTTPEVSLPVSSTDGTQPPITSANPFHKQFPKALATDRHSSNDDQITSTPTNAQIGSRDLGTAGPFTQLFNQVLAAREGSTGPITRTSPTTVLPEQYKFRVSTLDRKLKASAFFLVSLAKALIETTENAHTDYCGNLYIRHIPLPCLNVTQLVLTSGEVLFPNITYNATSQGSKQDLMSSLLYRFQAMYWLIGNMSLLEDTSICHEYEQLGSSCDVIGQCQQTEDGSLWGMYCKLRRHFSDTKSRLSTLIRGHRQQMIDEDLWYDTEWDEDINVPQPKCDNEMRMYSLGGFFTILTQAGEAVSLYAKIYNISVTQ